MFGKIMQALTEEDVYTTDEEEDSGSERQSETRDTGPAFNFWSVASQVTDAVKRNTAELAQTVRETDWRAEIQAFGKDVLEETEELSQNAVAVVEHAVDAVEQLPQQASTALPAIQQRRQQVQQQLGQYGDHLGRFGREVISSTTDLFEQARDTIQQEMAGEEGRSSGGASGSSLPAAGPRYSRLEADIAAMQRDSSTYCDEPADSGAYAQWLKDFDLEQRRPDIEAVIRDNTFMAELQSRIVPLIVEHDVFWRRYFYRLHLIQQAHEQRTRLAARAAAPPEEEVGWDSHDDELPSPLAGSPSAKAQPLAPAHPVAAHLAAAPPQPAQQPADSGSRGPAVQAAAGRADTQPAAEEGGVSADSSPHSPPRGGLRGSSGGASSGGGSAVSSGVRVSRAPSEEEAATASDGSGPDPWTVVSSPSRRSQPAMLPPSVPEAAQSTHESSKAPNAAAADVAAPDQAAVATDEDAAKTAETSKSDDALPAGLASLTLAAPQTAAPVSPVQPAGAAAEQTEGGPAVQQPDATATPAAATDDADEDDDVFDDVDVADAGDGDSSVDESWGKDWE